MIDIHCHILPEIDDGPADWEESLTMAALAAGDGIKQIICTPHHIPGLYTPSPDTVRGMVLELNRRLQEKGIALSVHSGMEVHLDPEIPGLLAEGRLLTLSGHDRHLLLELPLQVIPEHVEEIIWSLQLQRITPILAHIERYPFIIREPNHLNRWLQKGVLTQVTGPSLFGRYGNEPRDFALELIERRMVHFLATDGHGADSRRPLLSSSWDLLVREGHPEDMTRTLLLDNPLKLLQGERIDPPEPVWFEEKKKRWFKLKALFCKSH